MPTNNRSETTLDELIIETPELLQVSFGRILRETGRVDYPDESLVVEVTPLAQAAILSRCYKVTVSTLQNGNSISSESSFQFIAKFLKSSLPLEEMFQVEGTFYRKHAKNLERAVTQLHIPQAVYCGSKCIVLEYVQHSTSYTLLESCPPHCLPLVLSTLAGIHAHFWDAPLSQGLSSTAGIGMAMSGIEKERTFPNLWQDFVNDITDLYVSTRQKLESVCTDLSQRRLRDVHECVHEHKPTLIHGDYHVGNMLFHEEEEEDDDGLTILDWATCGGGNNMVDVVFFLLVSTRLDVDDIFNTWLPFYYKVLVDNDNVVEYSWETCVFDFRTCLLNQFLILVCYDKISNTLVDTQVDSEQAIQDYSLHFANVNKRCVDALLSKEMNLAEYPLPPFKAASDVVQSRVETSDVGNDNVIRQL